MRVYAWRRKEKFEWCIAATRGGEFKNYQCSHKRGHGPDGLFCKRHAMMIEQGRHVTVPEDTP